MNSGEVFKDRYKFSKIDKLEITMNKIPLYAGNS
jgi:hypothetical protein